MKFPLTLTAFLSMATASAALAGWNVESFAGVGNPGFAGDFGKAVNSLIYNPFGVLRGPDKAIWFCDLGNNRIRRIRADGVMFTFAGSGRKDFSPSGTWIQETCFRRPSELRFDSKGDLFVAEMGNHLVRKIDMQTGKTEIVAGTGFGGYSGDGSVATVAHLRQPQGIQFGPDGDLYICDSGNHVIRRVEMKTKNISTFAGTGSPGITPDGAPIEGTPLNGPRSMEFDASGDLWLVTREGSQVLRFDMKAGCIRVIAGTGEKGFVGGLGKQAKFNGPSGLAFDADKNVWIADTENHAVRMIEAKTGNVLLIAGTGERGDGPDGDASKCKLSRLHGIYADSDGSIFITDSESHRIRVLRKK